MARPCAWYVYMAIVRNGEAGFVAAKIGFWFWTNRPSLSLCTTTILQVISVYLLKATL